MSTQKNLLLIFTRNPVIGKCKTRLAAVVGDQAALDIYRFLIDHTVKVTHKLPVSKVVYYSDEIWLDDQWDPSVFKKELQKGADLGERMSDAFRKGFDKGYSKIVIIGSDLYELAETDLVEAFESLNTSDYVIGPAKDGGYYLLGMKKPNADIFRGKAWGTSSVLKETLQDIGTGRVSMLPLKNDIDYYEDIKDTPEFRPFIKHVKHD